MDWVISDLIKILIHVDCNIRFLELPMSDSYEEKRKNRLISLPEAAEIYGFNPKYLAQLAKKGRLSAQKIGGVWLTTQKDVETYIRSRKRKGAFRDDIVLD